MIQPPDTLKGEALKYWEKIFPILTERGTYSEADFEALEMLCSLYGQWKEVSADISKNGTSYKTETDRGAYVERERPEMKSLIDLSKLLQNYQRKFGLTPFDRKNKSRTVTASKQIDINVIREKY